MSDLMKRMWAERRRQGKTYFPRIDVSQSRYEEEVARRGLERNDAEAL